MSRLVTILLSVGICIAAAALEGMCAGNNVKKYFAKLTLPKYSAPLWVWYIIGVVYYAIFVVVLYRTLRAPASGLKYATLALIFVMMIVNAGWNYVFFRAQNLVLSFAVISLFPVLDLTLLVCLIRLDEVAAWMLVPYLLYRGYSVWWGYGLWKSNRSPS